MNSAIYQYYPLKGDQLTCVVCGYSYRKDAPLSTLQKHLRVKHQFSIRKPLTTGALDQAIQDAKEPVFSNYVAPGVYIPLLHKSQKNSETDQFTELTSDSSSKPSTSSFHESRNELVSNPRANSTIKTAGDFEDTILKPQKYDSSSQTHSSINLTPTRNFNDSLNLGDNFSEAFKGNLSSLLNPPEISRGTSSNSESIEEALVDWILGEKIPLSSVTAPSFQALLHRISPNLVAPSEERLRARLAQRFEMVMGCNSSKVTRFSEQTKGDNTNSLDSTGGFSLANLSSDNVDPY